MHRSRKGLGISCNVRSCHNFRVLVASTCDTILLCKKRLLSLGSPMAFVPIINGTYLADYPWYRPARTRSIRQMHDYLTRCKGLVNLD